MITQTKKRGGLLSERELLKINYEAGQKRRGAENFSQGNQSGTNSVCSRADERTPSTTVANSGKESVVDRVPRANHKLVIMRGAHEYNAPDLD